MGDLVTTALLSFWDYLASNEENKLQEKIEHNKRKDQSNNETLRWESWKDDPFASEVTGWCFF